MENRLFRRVAVLGTIGILALLAVSALSVKQYCSYKLWQPLVSLPVGDTDVPEGLVGHWEFDTVSNNSTPNSCNHSGDGVFRNYLFNATRPIFGTPSLTEGVRGNALEFAGRQWISAGNKNCFNTDKFTLAVWVWQAEDDGAYVPTIMSKSEWPKYNGWWLCTTTEASGANRDRDVNLAISWGNGFAHIKSGFQLPLREWHHIAVTMDNEAHEVQFYVNGVATGPRHTDVPNWLINWNHDLFLGDYDGSGRWPWVGKLDDVRFYRGVLSAQDIAAIFSGNPADKPEELVMITP